LTVPVNTPPDPRTCGAGTEIGRATLDFTVPEGAEDVPVDVGDVEAKLLPSLKVGDLAPDFTAMKLGGGRLKLSESQGKLVLLDFWATWCGPCLAEMPAMKELQETFGGDRRFVLVGMSCDEDHEAPTRYAKENGLGWTQALAGNLHSGVAAAYLVRAIPATFLVGPNGRILAKNLRGPALKEAVHNALKDDTLFSAAKESIRPPRFPVTRFDARTEDGAPADAPAVVVLDDCDEDFQEGRSHHDGLRFLGRAGNELRVLKDFNTCQSVGACHCIAVDAPRGRVYVCELVAHRVTATDLRGQRLWRVDNINADALAVDPRTGNLWCSVGGDLAHGETVVLDGVGREIASFPVRGIDLAYDPHTDGFWLVGYGIWKLSREGEVLFHKPHEGWACVSVAPDSRDGSVWIAEREHPDVARSANRLWKLDAKGGVIRSESLGKRHPVAVACDPRTGSAWVVDLRSEVLCLTADGHALPPLPIKATAVAVSPTTGDVWVTTDSEVLRVDPSGAVLSRTPFGSRSRQTRLAAF
jgi:thiol-disulfide isomerase/thioredoxin